MRRLLRGGLLLCCAILCLGAVRPSFAQQEAATTYFDNRSTPDSLLRSYYNAINRKEYARAYSYWESGAPQLQPFNVYAQGFANTQSVQLTLGTLQSDAGAGQLYYSVPATLNAQLTSGAAQTYVGCFTLHLAQPAIQGVPFSSLSIARVTITQYVNGVDTAALLASACPASGGSVSPSTPDADPSIIDATRYLDDRSDGIQVIRSLFNAVNRKEYARAYGYWDNVNVLPIPLPPFDQFQQGYANTETIQLTTGTLSGGTGAGWQYASVPVTLIAHTSGGITQTYVGCYRLHLIDPTIALSPPFHPLSIYAANVVQVANDANTAPMMALSCTQNS